MPDSLNEHREELDAKRALHQQIFDEAAVKGEDGEETHDLKQVECLGTAVNELEGTEKARKVASIAKELEAAIAELDEKVCTAEAAQGFHTTQKHFERQRKRPAFPTSSVTKDATGRPLSVKQIARRVVEDPTFKAWRQGSHDGKIQIDASLLGTKTLMSTSAGFEPESTRTGQVVDIPLRPPQIVDIMPRGQTGQANVVYMRQTERTQAAAEVAEGAAKPEAAFVFAEESTPVREVAVSLPVTDIQLEDVPFIESLIETMLREDIDERLDGQILIGDGVAPNLEGILNVTGIQNVVGSAAAGDDLISTAARAGAAIRTGIARAIPTHVLFHPDDWTDIMVSRVNATADQRFLIGNPQDMTAQRLWSWPVVINEELTPGTGLIGGFAARNVQLVERRGVVVERGFVNNQFVENQQTLRASMRAAVAIFRPAAFATFSVGA